MPAVPTLKSGPDQLTLFHQQKTPLMKLIMFSRMDGAEFMKELSKLLVRQTVLIVKSVVCMLNMKSNGGMLLCYQI